MSKANKAVVERWNKEIFNAGNVAAVDEIVAAGLVHHGPRGEQRGSDVIKQACRRWHTAFADLHFEVTAVVAEGDRVDEHWTFKGTHKGEWQGVPATGLVVSFTGVTSLKVADGKIVETWVHTDDAEFLRQVGQAPPIPAASEAVLQGWAEIWNQGKLAAIDQVVATDCVMHSSLRGDERGRDPVRQSYERYRAAFPDLYFTVIARVAAGDKASQNWVFRGTHKGEWNGVAATGRPVTYQGANMFRIADGKLAEIWSYWDAGAFMRQVGQAIG